MLNLHCSHQGPNVMVCGPRSEGLHHQRVRTPFFLLSPRRQDAKVGTTQPGGSECSLLSVGVVRFPYSLRFPVFPIPRLPLRLCEMTVFGLSNAISTSNRETRAGRPRASVLPVRAGTYPASADLAIRLGLSAGPFQESVPPQARAALCGVLASSPGARDAKPVLGWFAVPPDTAEAPAKPWRTAGSMHTSSAASTELS